MTRVGQAGDRTELDKQSMGHDQRPSALRQLVANFLPKPRLFYSEHSSSATRSHRCRNAQKVAWPSQFGFYCRRKLSQTINTLIDREAHGYCCFNRARNAAGDHQIIARATFSNHSGQGYAFSR